MDTRNEIIEAGDEVAALRAEIALLRDGQAAAEAERDMYRAALVPFAEAASDGDAVLSGGEKALRVMNKKGQAVQLLINETCTLKVSHLRAAADALKAKRP